MPDPTPADELRTAAATLRARAHAASEASSPPWTPDDPMDPELAWIALVDPGMGPLLADWLQEEAEKYDNNDECSRCHCDNCWGVDACVCVRRAMAVARKINAAAPEESA